MSIYDLAGEKVLGRINSIGKDNREIVFSDERGVIFARTECDGWKFDGFVIRSRIPGYEYKLVYEYMGSTYGHYFNTTEEVIDYVESFTK